MFYLLARHARKGKNHNDKQVCKTILMRYFEDIECYRQLNYMHLLTKIICLKIA
jgi:hypothetical protein